MSFTARALSRSLWSVTWDLWSPNWSRFRPGIWSVFLVGSRSSRRVCLFGLAGVSVYGGFVNGSAVAAERRELTRTLRRRRRRLACTGTLGASGGRVRFRGSPTLKSRSRPVSLRVCFATDFRTVVSSRFGCGAQHRRRGCPGRCRSGGPGWGYGPRCRSTPRRPGVGGAYRSRSSSNVVLSFGSDAVPMCSGGWKRGLPGDHSSTFSPCSS